MWQQQKNINACTFCSYNKFSKLSDHRVYYAYIIDKKWIILLIFTYLLHKRVCLNCSFLRCWTNLDQVNATIPRSTYLLYSEHKFDWDQKLTMQGLKRWKNALVASRKHLLFFNRALFKRNLLSINMTCLLSILIYKEETFDCLFVCFRFRN